MAIQSDHEFAPTQIARAVFPTAFRGYDQDAVRRFLSRLAAALEHQQEYAGLGELEARTPAHERVDELESEIEILQQEIKDLELELVQQSVNGDSATDGTDLGGSEGSAADDERAFDESRAIELLGQETARVLESARSAAADIIKRAETQAASLKAQAKSELSEARRRSETLLAQKRTEAHELVERLNADAEANAERVKADAEQHRAAVLTESSKILAEAEALSEAEQAEAEQRAKQIVADAETLRQQVISELVAERRTAQGEMDRITAARDRLALSLAVARSELDEVADALTDAPTGRRESSPPATGGAAEGISVAEEVPVAQEVHDPDVGDTDVGDTDVGDTGSRAAEEHAAEVQSLIDELDSGTIIQELDLRDEQDGPGVTERPKSSGKGSSDPKSATQPDSPSKTKRSAGAAKKRKKSANGSTTKSTAKSTAESTPASNPNPKTDVTAELAVSEPEAESESELDSQLESTDVAVATRTEPVTESETDLEVESEPEAASELEDETTDAFADIELGLELDTSPVLDLADYSEFNELPADGEALSLVEGFTTIELGDADATGDATASETGLGTHAGSGGDDMEHDDAGHDENEMQYSVLVNTPEVPGDVITTVASRTAASQLDRTRGDLLIDEPFTGRLPKQFAARDRVLTRSGPNFRRQLRRALNDDQSEVLDLLRGGRGVIKVDELPQFGDQIDRYLAPLRRGLTEIAQAGAKAGGRNELSQSALDNLVRQLAKYIVDKVRIPTIQVIQETPDQDRERILEPIRALYRDFRNVGLPDLTEDALYEAFAIGLYDSIEPLAPVRWIVDPRSDPDPICEINRDRDDLAKGETFPSGHARPLSLPGCRCLVVTATY